jgi:nucleoside 2-deoxyribosyltransferase
LRADEFWNEDAIIQDIVNLISESEVVVCDVTGRNPDVFYEAGIAHAIGKRVILITKNDIDVPFDLKHIRYVRYLPNEQGLQTMQGALRERS